MGKKERVEALRVLIRHLPPAQGPTHSRRVALVEKAMAAGRRAAAAARAKGLREAAEAFAPPPAREVLLGYREELPFETAARYREAARVGQEVAKALLLVQQAAKKKKGRYLSRSEAATTLKRLGLVAGTPYSGSDMVGEFFGEAVPKRLKQFGGWLKGALFGD